jgi:hypothetical protein
MRLLELFELQAQEGPCLDAFHTGERVAHEDLAAGSGRWPSFSVAEAGFRSALALPLRLREVTLGALNLLSVTQTPMAEADVIVARAFADLATLSIIQHRASTEAQRVNEQLAGALSSRVVIEQAKGVISERVGVDLAEVLARLPGATPATAISASPMSPKPPSTAPSTRWRGSRQLVRPAPDHPGPACPRRRGSDHPGRQGPPRQPAPGPRPAAADVGAASPGRPGPGPRGPAAGARLCPRCACQPSRPSPRPSHQDQHAGRGGRGPRARSSSAVWSGWV